MPPSQRSDDNNDEADDDDARATSEEEEEQQAEDEIREQVEQDERDQREGKTGSSLAGWLFAKRKQIENEKEGSEDQGAARDVEASGLPEEGWTVPKSETRLLPIISGLVCPFSVLLDIPGLTERWYVRTENHVVVETQPNSPLLDIGLSISLALGVIANLALIARFLEHRPRLFTWISMLCLTVHDVINTVAVTVFAVLHSVDDGFTNGSAYWLTVASTSASLVCNITLGLDLWKTKDFNKKGSGLTEKQRSLTIATMALLLYMGLGALIFHYLIVDIDFISSLYFTICTITSVGFGDIVPLSVGSRIFSYFYDPIGLVFIALTVALARECLIESFEESYRQRRDKLARRAHERKEAFKKRLEEKEERRKREEKERELEVREKGKGREEAEKERELGRLNMEARRASGGSRASRSRRGSLSGWAGTLRKAPSLLMPSAPGASSEPASPAATDGNGSGDSPPAPASVLPSVGLCPSPSPTSPASAGAPSTSPSSTSRWSWRRPLLFFHRSSHPSSTSPSQPRGDASSPSSTTRAQWKGEGGAPLHHTISSSTSSSIDDSFRSLKAQLAKEQKQEFRLKLGISIVLFLLFWLVGAAVFQATEKWTYFEGLWFGFVYFTTIGYGDLSPKSEAGRAFFCCWAILGIFNMTLLISVLTESFSSRYKSRISSGRVRKALRRVKPSAKRQPILDNEVLAMEGKHPLPGHRGTTSRAGGGLGGKKENGGGTGSGNGSGKASPIPPQELPEKIAETVKGFHEHARYFMLGRTGLPPQDLRFLYDAAEADELDERLPDVVKGGPTSLADAGTQGDMKQYLFLIAYERQFDALLESAEQLSSFLASQRDELSSLRAENEALLGRVEGGSGEEGKEERNALGARFVRRPPGGYGDEIVEEEMVREEEEEEGGLEEEEKETASVDGREEDKKKVKDSRRSSSSSLFPPQRPELARRKSSLATGDLFPTLSRTTSPTPLSGSSPSPAGPSSPAAAPPSSPSPSTSTSPPSVSPPHRRGIHLPHLRLPHSYTAAAGRDGQQQQQQSGGGRRSSLSFRLPPREHEPVPEQEEGRDGSGGGRRKDG